MANKKQTSKLSKKQLDYYRQLLVEKMYEILGDVSALEETLFQGSGELSKMPVHLADVGTDSYEQEFNLGLVAEERKTLLDIQHALDRIDDGSIPWTRYSLEYAKMIESGKAIDVENIKLRPIDIQRNEEIEDDEEVDDQDEELSADEMELGSRMLSLNELEDEDSDDEDNDDFNRHKDSA
ncbi:MAG: TraR/DksA family transcriptional regulator [Planctomycetota bacterium]|jgi:RNA polymerase-binding transcription factor DksA